jgi:hypothetical protein
MSAIDRYAVGKVFHGEKQRLADKVCRDIMNLNIADSLWKEIVDESSLEVVRDVDLMASASSAAPDIVIRDIHKIICAVGYYYQSRYGITFVKVAQKEEV